MDHALWASVQRYVRQGYTATYESETSAALERPHPLTRDDAVYLRIVGGRVRRWDGYRMVYETPTSVSLLRPGTFSDGGSLYLRFDNGEVQGPGLALVWQDWLFLAFAGVLLLAGSANNWKTLIAGGLSAMDVSNSAFLCAMIFGLGWWKCRTTWLKDLCKGLLVLAVLVFIPSMWIATP